MVAVPYFHKLPAFTQAPRKQLVTSHTRRQADHKRLNLMETCGRVCKPRDNFTAISLLPINQLAASGHAQETGDNHMQATIITDAHSSTTPLTETYRARALL